MEGRFRNTPKALIVFLTAVQHSSWCSFVAPPDEVVGQWAPKYSFVDCINLAMKSNTGEIIIWLKIFGGDIMITE